MRYVGLALAPAVLLAPAEFGPGRALLVIAGIMVINAVAEDGLSPALTGRGLSLFPPGMPQAGGDPSPPDRAEAVP